VPGGAGLVKAATLFVYQAAVSTRDARNGVLPPECDSRIRAFLNTRFLPVVCGGDLADGRQHADSESSCCESSTA
jgi:hypothetical protein